MTNGKGKGPIKGYNNRAYRDNYPFAERKTSQEWCDKHQVFVIDPDGWDRANLASAWAERITEAEFNDRLLRSTMMHRTEDKASEENKP